MGRNTEKDALYTVSIPRDSELLQMLQDDAEGCNLSIAKMIVVRLKDWYMPSGSATNRAAIRPIRTEGPAPAPEMTETVDEEIEVEQPLDDNTNAVMDAWL